MEHYEEMEEDVCEFKKYAKMTLDLMIDAYKWKRLSMYADDQASKEKFQRVSNSLYEMFMQEHNHIGEMFKE